MKSIYSVLVLFITVLCSAITLASDMDAACSIVGQRTYRYEYGPAKGAASRTYVVTRRPFADPGFLPAPKLLSPGSIVPYGRVTWVVYFGFGSSRLSESEEEKLYRLSSIIDRKQAVDVTGYTCRAGGFDVNKRLARRRAETVATWLETRGVKVGRVNCKPKCCYLSDREPAKNRRVEIRFVPEAESTR